MPDAVTLWVNEAEIQVPAGTTVAAAVLMTGQSALRTSVSGEKRGPLCGMGICFECRVNIDGLEHCRSCQIVCRDGMKIRTT
jgi:sarcosine oxidase subunit alpha